MKVHKGRIHSVGTGSIAVNAAIRCAAMPFRSRLKTEFSRTYSDALLQRRLRQLHRTVRISSSPGYIVLLPIHGPRRQGREVDVRSAVRQLVVDHNPAGSSESARGGYATG